MHTLPVMPVGGCKETSPHGGPMTSAPTLTQFQVMEITQSCLSTISQAAVWGDPKEAQIWHGLSPPSTSSGGGEGEEIWASGCMGPSMSSPSPLGGRGSKKAHLTHQHQRELALCLWAVMQGLSGCPPLQLQATLVS